MKHICWLVLLATLITLPVLCQARPNQEGVYEVLGVGTLSCEVWTKDRADRSSGSHFIVLGFRVTSPPLMSSAMARATLLREPRPMASWRGSTVIVRSTPLTH